MPESVVQGLFVSSMILFHVLCLMFIFVGFAILVLLIRLRPKIEELTEKAVSLSAKAESMSGKAEIILDNVNYTLENVNEVGGGIVDIVSPLIEIFASRRRRKPSWRTALRNILE